MSYVFRTTWTVEASVPEVFDVLADVASYPSWWPQVRSAREISDGEGELVCRSLLPYDLTFVMTRVREDAATGVLEARMSGDLNGTGRWTVTASDTGCTAVFDEDVEVGRGLLKAAGLVARPALRFNHDRMMRGGERGLRKYLRATGQ